MVNSDKFVRMARQAELGALADLWTTSLERFAALVAADERKACVRVCALVADDCADMHDLDGGAAARMCSALIQARGMPNDE